MIEFWKNRRVLITGHTGFKGSWLTKWLDMIGAHTLGLSLPPNAYSIYEKLRFSDNHKSVYADVRDRVALGDAVRNFGPELVFHLAAQAIVGEAKKESAATFETNLMGTVNLLNAVNQSEGVKAVVVVTSDKVYKNVETLAPYKEDACFGGDEPYAASKACAELAVIAYRNAILSSDIGVATVRAANVYGGGDLHFDRLIPYLIRAKLENTLAEIRNPNAVRPWQYVLSPLYGYLLLAKALYIDPAGYSEGFNFGPPNDELFRIEQIAEMIMENNYSVSRAGSNFHEAGLLRIDSAKSRARLGWKPVMDIRTGLAATMDFYRGVYDGVDATLLMEKAIGGIAVGL